MKLKIQKNRIKGMAVDLLLRHAAKNNSTKLRRILVELFFAGCLKLLMAPVVFLTAAFFPFWAYAHDASQDKQIVYFNSYHKGYKWSDDLLAGIEAYYNKHDNQRQYTVYTEYMDTKRCADEEYFSQLLKLYRHKYSGQVFDMILCSDDNAFQFIRKHRDSLFPGIPVVFCGVNYFDASQLEGMTNVTGVNEVAGIDETIQLILKIHPETESIYIVNDTTITGQKVHGMIMKTVAAYKNRVKFISLEDRRMDELLRIVASLPRNSVIFYTFFFRDASGTYFENNDIIREIAEKSNAPIYGVWDFNLGSGMVGGMLTSGYFQGYTAAELAARVLNGENINHLPVVMKSPNRYMFDYRQLNKYSIDMGTLPPGSIIINKSKTFIEFYNEYRDFVMTIASVFFAVLSSLLIFIGIKMRIAKRKIQISEEKYRTIFENTGTAMMIIEEDTTISLANSQFEKISGYSIAEVENKMSWTKFIPQKEDLDRMLNYHRQRRENEITPVSYEFTFLDKDNKHKQAFVTVSNISGSQKSVASLIDITQKKLMEKERENLIAELQDAMSRIKTLSGLLPICAFCKKIRDDEGYWQQLEKFFLDHSETKFSHGVCPECMATHYPE